MLTRWMYGVLGVVFAGNCIQCSRFRNGEPPSEQAPTPRKSIQSSRLRNSKPPSEHAPKPDKNAAPHHPRKLPNVAFWSPKKRSYTAKATTRLHLEKMGPDASASKVAASATANHHPNTPQNHAKTHRDTTQKITISVTSLARSPWNDGVGGYIPGGAGFLLSTVCFMANLVLIPYTI